MPVESDVSKLSDDEPGQLVHAEPVDEAKPAKKSSGPRPVSIAEVRGKLGRLVRTLCACARQGKATTKHSCFAQFQGSGLDALLQLRCKLLRLEKQDMDNEVGSGSNKRRIQLTK